MTYIRPKVCAKEMTLMCSRNANIEDFDCWLDLGTVVMKATVNFNS